MLTYSGFFFCHCTSAELYNTVTFCDLSSDRPPLGAEFFPTTIRNSALGVANFSARVGGMIAPYIVDLVVTISQIRTCEFKITHLCL